MEKILEDSVYQFLLYFDKLYDEFINLEKKQFLMDYAKYLIFMSRNSWILNFEVH